MSKRKRSASSAQAQTELPLDSGPAFTVYVLCDPRVDDPVLRIRYVGVTHKTLAQRLNAHVKSARHGERNYRCNWIRELLAAGLRPVAEAIDPGTAGRAWDRSEIAWIKHFREQGCPLTNGTDGGEGTLGVTHPEEIRSAIVSRQKNAENVARLRQLAKSQRGTKRSIESIEKGKRTMAEHPEIGERLALCRRGRKPTDETRAKLSEAHRGRCQTNAAKEKISAAAKARYRDPVWRERHGLKPAAEAAHA